MPWKTLKLATAKERQALDSEYRGKARFLIDESMGAEVAEIVHANGYNAKYVAEQGLVGRSDEDVFAAAWRDKRVLVTHDPDFLDDRRFPPHRNPGIVLVRPGSNGRDNHGLLVCLIKAAQIAGEHATWFRGRKLDFSSEEMLTISSRGTRERYWWAAKSDPMVWEDDE
jgi:predicted nuclease of predicted toxin-antitoxin system